MGMIYENAPLTVAASLSSADKDGFFRQRTQHLSHTFNIKHPSIEIGTAELKVRTAFKKHLRRDIGRIRDNWRENCECGVRRRLFETDGPDARNGSPRQVHQSLQQDDQSVPSMNLRGGNSRELSMALVNVINPSRENTSSATAAAAPLKDERERNAWLLWRTRPSYSQLRLTKEMDRLPALSAIARGLESLCGGERYLAGMWLSDLATSLSWQAGAFATNRPQPGRSPS